MAVRKIVNRPPKQRKPTQAVSPRIDALIARLREIGYNPRAARRHMKPENGLYRNLTSVGMGVSRTELEEAYRQMIRDAHAHDKKGMERARKRWMND